MRYRVAKKVGRRLDDLIGSMTAINFYTVATIQRAVVALRHRFIRGYTATSSMGSDYFAANRAEDKGRRLAMFFPWQGRGRARVYRRTEPTARRGHRYPGLPYGNDGKLRPRKNWPAT